MWTNGLQFTIWIARIALVSFVFGLFCGFGWWLWNRFVKVFLFGSYAHDNQESAWRIQGVQQVHRRTVEQETLDRLASEKAARSSGDKQSKTEG